MSPKNIKVTSLVVVVIGMFVLGFSIYYVNVLGRYGADAGVLDPEYTHPGARDSAAACAEIGGKWITVRDPETGKVLGYRCEIPKPGGGEGKIVILFKPNGDKWDPLR